MITVYLELGEGEMASTIFTRSKGGMPYLFSHQTARILIFEEVPVSKNRVSNHFRGLLIDGFEVEAFCVRWSVANIQESVL